MMLSNNLSLESLTFSETAVRRDLDNTPNPEQIQNLTELAQTLEKVMELLHGELHIHSAFRSIKVNLAVGGSASSAHLDGNACDFECPSFGSPLEVCKAIAGSEIPFDQLIQEGKWVHLSIDHRMRRELLTASFIGGKASYTNGIA